MHRVALALMGAAALTFGSAANASVTVNSSTMTYTAATVGSTTTIGYEDVTLSTPTFTESLTFTNTLAGLYAITLTTSSAAVDFTSAILNGPGGSMNALTNVNGNGVNEFFALNPTTLAAGQYTLNILGNNSSVGSLGGSITISAVPEPGTWALMLIGFGGIGFAMRRGRKQAITQIA